MLFSAFAPFGMWEFSSKPTHAETLYFSMIAGLGGQYSTEPGSREDAKIYADAMALACALYVLEHAGAQVLPTQLVEMLPVREGEYGVVPGPRDTDDERRAAVAAAFLLPRGAARTEVDYSLRTLLGDAFVAYRPTPADEAMQWPTDLGDQPQNLQLPTVARKLIRLTAPVVSGLGSPQNVRYARFVPDPNPDASIHSLLVGDVLVIDPGDLDRAETVTVVAVGEEVEFETTYTTFRATFNNVHAAGVPGTTAPWPVWVSSKRVNLIVLTGEAAANADIRRRANEHLRKQLRGISTWYLAGETSPGSMTTGPFQVGIGKLGITTIGSIAL